MSTKAPNLTDRHVGSRVRMRRLMLEMSQTGLAHALGLTFQQVQKYEKGSNRIGSSRMQQIANALQVKPAFFFEGLPGPSRARVHPPIPEFISEMLATKDGLALVKAFMQIKSAKLMRSIVHLVEELAANDDK